MTTGRFTRRRRQFLTALVCLETSLVVGVTQGRDTGSAAVLLAEHAADAEVVACDLVSGYKTAADTLTDATVVADVFHLVRLGLAALDEVRRLDAAGRDHCGDVESCGARRASAQAAWHEAGGGAWSSAIARVSQR